jgi:hypothetical protein
MDNVSYLAPSVFAFYMIVAANFLPELLGCRMQAILRNNMYVKHLTGWVLLFFLVVSVNPSMSSTKWWQVIIASLIIYLWFLIISRAPFSIACSTVLILLVIYLLSIQKDKYEKDKRDQNQDTVSRLTSIQNILIVVSVIMSVVGFCIYILEKKAEYGKKFEVLKFVFGNTKCRNFTPSTAIIV